MIKTLAAAVLALALGAASAQASPSSAEAVAASDRIRNPDHPFGVTLTLTEYVDSRPRDTVVLRVLSKQDPGSGQFRSLVAFQEPARDRGKLMLRRGGEVWFYDPASKTSVRISPQQRLLGQASNGDVVTTNFALDYAVEVEGGEEVQDADRKARRCLKLRMKATSPAATYDAVEYWIDAEAMGPVKGKFYAESGRLLKIAFYRGYRDVLGTDRPTETLIIDGVDTSRVTRMVFSGHRAEEIPEAWLQRDYLPRLGAN